MNFNSLKAPQGLPVFTSPGLGASFPRRRCAGHTGVLFLFLFFLQITTSVYSIDISICKDVLNKQVFYLNVCFGESPSAVITKESIKISVDTPDIIIQEWFVEDGLGGAGEAIEEYVVPLKLRKKVYKNSFRIKIVTRDATTEKKTEKNFSFCFSCFVVESGESIRSLYKKVSFQKAKKRSFSGSPKDKGSRNLFFGARKFCHDRPIWLVNAKYLFFLLMGLIFIGFLIVDVLSFFDVACFLGLGIWAYFSRFIVSHFLVLFICAIWLLVLAIWYLVIDHLASTRFLKITRIVLGLACASGVLPLLVQAYLSFCL